MFQQQKNIGLIFCYRWTELFISFVSVRKASVFDCCSWYVDILALLSQIVFAGWSRSDATSRIYLQSCVKCNVYTISKKKKKSQANLFAYCENIIKNNVIELKKHPWGAEPRLSVVKLSQHILDSRNAAHRDAHDPWPQPCSCCVPLRFDWLCAAVFRPDVTLIRLWNAIRVRLTKHSNWDVQQYDGRKQNTFSGNTKDSSSDFDILCETCTFGGRFACLSHKNP